MKKTLVELITCEDGDWEVLKLNGKLFTEGHKIEPYCWIKLFQKIKNANALNTNVIHKNISNEDMENGNY